MGALTQPATGTGSIRGERRSIGEQIGSRAVEFHGKIAQQQMGIPHREQVQFLVIGGRPQRVQLRPHPTDRVGLKGGLGGFIAIPPRRGAIVVHTGVDQFHARSLACCQ